MPKYKVTFNYHTFCDFVVEAEDKNDAILEAQSLTDHEQCLDNLEERGDTECEEIEDWQYYSTTMTVCPYCDGSLKQYDITKRDWESFRYCPLCGGSIEHNNKKRNKL